MIRPGPWAESCERNREPILAGLREQFVHPGRVLELGSGTGQHAVHFASAMPWLDWQPTDLEPQLAGINGWRDALGPDNLLPPRALDMGCLPWPEVGWTHAFSANTAHIVSWPTVQTLFAGIGQGLPEHGRFCLYGPFHRDGRPTSTGNHNFDLLLRARDPDSGIRDRGDLVALAERNGLRLITALPMPANNELLVWGRGSKE